jgi:creatinine amidohydrolase
VNQPIRLSELTPAAAAAALARTPRLIIPVGTLVPRGPHLPLGCDTVLLERLADDLSAGTGIPRAPMIPFGVHAWVDRSCPGSAGLTRKTLHRVLNELIAAWETAAKVTETILLTAHPTESHQEALSTIRSEGVVRSIDVFGLDFDDLLARPQDTLHGGELDTSLLLAIAPGLVALERLPRDLDASAEKGAAIYQRMIDRLTAALPSPADPWAGRRPGRSGEPL